MTPVLYILMRTDLDSMNPGKACAQASHATNAFIKNITNILDQERPNIELTNLYSAWSRETPQGFGTAIVLGCNENQMRTVFDILNGLVPDVISEIIHDPTYPLKDGETTHLIPLDTCAYVFGDKDAVWISSLLNPFSLHP